MENELSIRQYRSADHKHVLQLHVEPMDDVDAFVEGDDKLDADLEDIELAYLDRGGDFLVGEINGQIAAMGAYKPPSEYFTQFLGDLPEKTAEITRMRVASESQGQGFGEKIYDELEHRARDDGFETLILDTTHRQKAAQGLYEKKDFREIERQDVEFDDDHFTMIFYKKSL